jgi:hypothetical protein
MTQQPEVMIGHAMDRFDQEGNLTDVVTKEFIIGLLQNLAEWTRRIARDDLPLYIFSGSEDPVGQRLEGVHVLIDRYRRGDLTSIAHDFYRGRHEMLHELIVATLSQICLSGFPVFTKGVCDVFRSSFTGDGI